MGKKVISSEYVPTRRNFNWNTHKLSTRKVKKMVYKLRCSVFPRYLKIFSTRYLVTCKIYTVYHATSDVEHDSSACVVDNPHAKARGLFLRTGGIIRLYLSLNSMSYTLRNNPKLHNQSWHMVYSILSNPITLEGRRSTTGEFATSCNNSFRP